jgi:hypothetical protein
MDVECDPVFGYSPLRPAFLRNGFPAVREAAWPPGIFRHNASTDDRPGTEKSKKAIRCGMAFSHKPP